MLVAGNGTERTALLVIRLWYEPGSPAQVKARITSTQDVSKRGAELVSTAASRREIEQIVQAWLDVFGESVDEGGW